ncbi:hypothetical protein [Alkaliphilus hydrothermalis]|uniref:Phosphoglyceromutase n=1 Tax=Alkaliphilus hydrothermalis TaxID=1482730 RepID=A0ABS2NM91_9FIRM|nr:hypothetical protein [Alkaliphilus hydrothermalis]MBM7613952.1 hypothetical protein [Alkaliphilus hydrothermalis]
MKIARLILLKLLIIATIVTLPLSVNAIENQQEEDKKVVMVVINHANLKDLKSMEEIHRLMEEGSIGLMNIRAAGRYSQYKSYATIGWGTRAEASSDHQEFVKINEESAAIYQRRTGRSPALGGIINLSINQLKDQNAKGEYKAFPGTLGEVLKVNGLKTVVLGNSDTDENKISSVALIPMDKTGHIDYGDVGEDMIMKNPQRPYGIQTNYNVLFNRFTSLYSSGDFIVIETGDLSRLESYRNYLHNGTYQRHRENILQEINTFTEQLTGYIKDDNTLLMVVVPYPSNDVFETGERITPVVFYSKEINEGLLTSDTTRREGIIANIDIAPTILKYFGLTTEEMTGREIQTLPWESNITYLQQLKNKVLKTSQQRYRVLYTFAVFEMLASVLTLLLIVYKKRVPEGWKKPIASVLLATIVAPFMILILPLLGSYNIFITYILLVLGTCIIVFLLERVFKKDPVGMLIATTGLVVLGLVVDIVTGQNLIKNSILGYDPIIGARYYGIGNEFAGVFVGASLVFTTAIVEKNNKLRGLIPFFYLFLIMVMGFPKWGANVGGTITAMVAFLFTTFRLMGLRMNLKKWAMIGLMVFMGVAAFAVVDLFILESKSHLAGAIQQIIRGGPWVILQIITRKIAMNIRVMGVTIWSRVLLMAILVLGVLLYKPIGVLKKIANAYPQLAIGWTGILVACGVGFAFNDSGVVTAALAAIFLSTSILYLVLKDFGQRVSNTLDLDDEVK